jgi:hypothetical protein
MDRAVSPMTDALVELGPSVAPARWIEALEAAGDWRKRLVARSSVVVHLGGEGRGPEGTLDAGSELDWEPAPQTTPSLEELLGSGDGALAQGELAVARRHYEQARDCFVDRLEPAERLLRLAEREIFGPADPFALPRSQRAAPGDEPEACAAPRTVPAPPPVAVESDVVAEPEPSGARIAAERFLESHATAREHAREHVRRELHEGAESNAEAPLRASGTWPRGAWRGAEAADDLDALLALGDTWLARDDDARAAYCYARARRAFPDHVEPIERLLKLSLRAIDREAVRPARAAGAPPLRRAS